MGKILYFSIQEFGHLNIGVSLCRHFRHKYGDRHRVYICVDQNFERILSALDPQLHLLAYHDPRAQQNNPLDSIWNELEQLGSLGSVELSRRIAAMIKELGEHLMSLKPEVERLLQQHKFDYILTDHVAVVPFLANKGIPWGLAFSLNILMFGLPTLPPATTGIGLDDRHATQKYLDECKVFFEPYQQEFDKHLQEHGCHPLTYHHLFYESPFLNFYIFPKELDYFLDARYSGKVNFQAAPLELMQKRQQQSVGGVGGGEPGQSNKSVKSSTRASTAATSEATKTTSSSDNASDDMTSVEQPNAYTQEAKLEDAEDGDDDVLPDEPLPEEIRWRNSRRRSTRKSIDIFNTRPRLPGNWLRLDSTVSLLDPTPAYVVPSKLANLPGELIFFSMGSLFSNCLPLMKRMVAMLAQLPYRFIVSKGPAGQELDPLPANCDGANFVPQRSVLGVVQLAIHHGGNNTLSECFHFGVPSLIMPLLGDQPDNAERLRDTGLGRTLNPYKVTLDELRSTIADLLADTDLRKRMQQIGKRIRADNGLDWLCDELVKYLEV